MIDLSFELGAPLHQLRAMPESDMLLYCAYIAKRMLPSRRLEMLVAQLSALVNNIGGGTPRSTADFLMDPSEDDEGHAGQDATPSADRIAALQAAFGGFNPAPKLKLQLLQGGAA